MTLLHWLSVARAGLGPADVLVLFNADDPDAVEVADHYAAVRSVPFSQLCGVSGVDPLATQVDWATFDGVIRARFEACLGALPQPDDIDVVVTVRGLPYVVTLGSGVVGMEAALQVGRGVDNGGVEIAGRNQGPVSAEVLNPEFVGIGGSCDPDDLTITNPFGGNYTATCALQLAERLPRGFARDRNREFAGYDLGHELFVVTRLDGFDYDDAMDLADRGVASDGALPDAEFLCMAGRDEARAARDPECELTTRRLTEAGLQGTWVPAHDTALTGHEVVAYMTGADDLRGSIAEVDYAPGAIACNLTSYGAVPTNFFCDADAVACPEFESQTSIARFVRAGVTGVHGTVFEPYNNTFPHAGTMVLYASGYTLGESFLYGQEYLHWANLVLGDPLAAPFAERPVVSVPASTKVGQPITVTASHPDGVTDLRLYLDGVLVAEAEADTVSWEHGGATGDRIPLLAVAVAADGEVERPGWPIATQGIQAETQGWTVASVQVYADAPLVPHDEEEEEKGCGCVGAPGSSGAPLALLGLLWVRRKREGSALPRD